MSAVESKNEENDLTENTVRIKKKEVTKDINDGKKKRMNPNLLPLITFLSGVVLIVTSYAWFSASLDVKIKFFDLVVSTDTGLFISLDGVEFTDSVEISANSVISELKKTYPNHTNQWAVGGLWPVSSSGIRDADSDRFDVFVGEVSRFKQKHNNKRFLNISMVTEDQATALNSYIAFDIFLKNVSGSPKSDNLYFDEGTIVEYDNTKEIDDEVKESMSNLMNSMRFGFVKIGSVSHKTDTATLQNLKCNNSCEMVIYEPNSTLHTGASIATAGELGITLVDGVYTPTYAVIKTGANLDHTNGQEGSGVPLDTEHFKLQTTITDFTKSIFQIPDAITKIRVYIWIEGQDVDSLETYSKGAPIYLAINFIKDLAGYDEYN